MKTTNKAITFSNNYQKKVKIMIQIIEKLKGYLQLCTVN